MTGRSKPGLWTCPQCGERFVTRHMSHSCGSHSIDEHFRGSEAVVREMSFMAGHLWLKRRRAHPAFHRVESLRDRDFVHNFRLASVAEIDRGFRGLLREAYAVGSQDSE